MAGHSIRDQQAEGTNAVRVRSPGIVLTCVISAILAAAISAGCGSNFDGSGLEATVAPATPTPKPPSASASVDVSLTGSDTETCELVFATGTITNGSVGEITDEPCVPGTPNRDSATVTFTAVPGVCGPGEGSFTYTTNDGSATSTPATVIVDIPCIAIEAEEP
jgi:hypothetical protein